MYKHVICVLPQVKSMTGVYIASQLDADASIHTVITRDRGAEWSRIKRPQGIPCVDEKKVVYFCALFGLYFVPYRLLPSHMCFSFEWITLCQNKSIYRQTSVLPSCLLSLVKMWDLIVDLTVRQVSVKFSLISISDLIQW